MPIQSELFSSLGKIPLPYADLILQRKWQSEREADTLMSALLNELDWEQPNIFIAGRARATPRMQVWSGEPGVQMSYSGRTFTAQGWHPRLFALKTRVEQATASRYNSVLLNYYRDEQDSVGWHADDEDELGQNPVIASLSLGATRTFLFKPKPLSVFRAPLRTSKILLQSGDLLTMAGPTQKYWFHSVPKSRFKCKPRLNLTFRQVLQRE